MLIAAQRNYFYSNYYLWLDIGAVRHNVRTFNQSMEYVRHNVKTFNYSMEYVRHNVTFKYFIEYVRHNVKHLITP